MSDGPSPQPTIGRKPGGQTVHLDGTMAQAVETGRTRLLIAGCLFAAAFVAIAARVVDVAILWGGAEPQLSSQPVDKPVETGRADIVDRNGILLATSLKVPSLFADPSEVIDPQVTARTLARVLPDLDIAKAVKRLSGNGRFVWLRRNLTPEQKFEINTLGLPGLHFQDEERRIYPQGALAAHVVGYSGVDANGLAGIERGMDRRLRGSVEPLPLALDVRVQHVVREEVQRQIDTFEGIGGAGVVMDVATGEIVSMVSLPDFDPNDAGGMSKDAQFNRASLGVYEMGSTFKIFNTAMLLDSGRARLSDRYDATKPIRVSRFTINDYHAKNRWLSVSEIFMHSSNIGSVRMAMDVGTEGQRAFMKKLGFFSEVPLEIPEVGAPMTPAVWRNINTMTIAFGHGIGVSPVHLAGGVSAMVNGGMLVPPTLLRANPETATPGRRIIKERTSKAVRRLLRLVVQNGTGRNADAKGYLVGGKTGTAEKPGANGRYARKSLLSSFVGVYPVHDPRYVVLVMVDEPKGQDFSYGRATGGWVAAPAVKRIVERTAPFLGVHPIAEMTPEIRRDLHVDLKNTKGTKRLASF